MTQDTGDTVRLRDVTDADVPIFFAQEQDEAAQAMAAFVARPYGAFLAHWARIRADPLNRMQTILWNDEVAGNIGSFELDGEREVGYWLGRAYWGRRVATRALAAFLQQERTRPLYAYVAAHNAASRRVLEKCGFRVLREQPAAPNSPLTAANEIVLVLDAETEQPPGPA